MAEPYLKSPLLWLHTDSPTVSPTSADVTVIAQCGCEVEQRLLQAVHFQTE